MDALCKLALRLPNIELQINLEYHAARSVYRAHVFQKINVGLPRTSATGSSYRTIESHVCVSEEEIRREKETYIKRLRFGLCRINADLKLWGKHA